MPVTLPGNAQKPMACDAEETFASARTSKVACDAVANELSRVMVEEAVRHRISKDAWSEL